MPCYSNDEYVSLMRPIPRYWKRDLFGIPTIKKSDIDITKLNNGLWLTAINNTSLEDKNKRYKIVHSFKFDFELKRYYERPYSYLKRVSSYYAVCTFDFSMHQGMEPAQIINATFMNRWSGVWLQMNGFKRVAVTVGWVDSDTFDICFAGIEDGTLLVISSLGVCKNKKSQSIFIKGYKEMRRRFPKSQVICVGNRVKGMDDDVCFVSFQESFGNHDKYYEYWQPKLFNWNYKE